MAHPAPPNCLIIQFNFFGTPEIFRAHGYTWRNTVVWNVYYTFDHNPDRMEIQQSTPDLSCCARPCDRAMYFLFVFRDQLVDFAPEWIRARLGFECTVHNNLVPPGRKPGMIARIFPAWAVIFYLAAGS